MNKEIKYLLKIIFIIIIIVFPVGYYIVWSNQIIKEYSLREYGCDKVEEAITYGRCLPINERRVNMFYHCFDVNNLYIYYKMNCKEESP